MGVGSVGGVTAGIPLIDVTPLRTGDADGAGAVARAIDAACREQGFFTIVGHGIDPALFARLDRAARDFFARPEAEKAEIAMERGGRAWRGWFPLGGELTSGRPDHKEGIYFGAELPADDPRVRSGLPLHGPNLFPAEPADLRPAVLETIDALTTVGHLVMEGIARGLGLPGDWFRTTLTADPTLLFRIFHYPAGGADPDRPPTDWGVGEHTDYGLLTLLAHDGTPGLQVRTPAGWVDVEPVAGGLICNLGDMLDRMTDGRYRATAHRVAVPTADRLSFPFFFDPSWDAEVRPLPLAGSPPADDAAHRWDGTSLRELSGTYGEYLMGKVGRVFPELGAGVLPGSERS